MTFLPIVERELRVASRRRGTYRSRYIAAIVAALLGGLTLLTAKEDPAAGFANGGGLLIVLSALVFAYTAVAGTQLTCDTLSAEKRDGTLGLLFLTDLRGYDVVFGKLVASSLTACYAMLAVMPVLAVSLVLGGATNGEFWRVVFVSANLLFFFASAGILSSSLCGKDQIAALNSTGFVVAFMLLLSLARLPNPAYGCFAAFDLLYAAHPGEFWMAAAATQLYGWLFLLCASWIVRNTWQDDPTDEARMGWREKWRVWAEGSPATRAAWRRKLVDANPFLWRASRPRMKEVMTWLFLGFAVPAWYACGRIFHLGLFDDIKDLVVALSIHFILKLWVATEAFRCFAEDRRNGVFELFLTTPLTAEQIVRGQQRALWRQFFGPVMAVLAVDFLFAAMAMQQARTTNAATGWLAIYMASAVFLVLDMNGLGWIGMKVGVSSRTPYRVMLLWYGALTVLSLGFSAFTCGLSTVGDDFGPSVCCALFLMTLASSFHIMYWHLPKSALLQRFRQLVEAALQQAHAQASQIEIR